MDEEQKKSRGVPKGSHRIWTAGKPKFANGDLQKVMVLLSDHHVSFLKKQGNMSATIRDLVEAAMTRTKKRGRKAAERKEQAAKT